MVFLENRFGALQIELIIRSLVPRQFGDPFEIGADHLRFHRLTTSSLESSELALYFGARLFRQLQLRELVAKLGDLFARVVVAQFFLDRFELLAQIHLSLTLAQFFLDLGLDVFLRLEQTNLPLHVDEYAAKALLHAQCFKQSLLFGNGKLDVAGDEIGKPTGLGYRVENLVNDFLWKSATLAELSCPLPRLFL